MEGVAEETGKKRSKRMGQGAMGLGMLGRRQVTPRWVNDPVWLHNGSRRDSGQGRMRAPPPRGKPGRGRRREEQVNNISVAYVTINNRA